MCPEKMKNKFNRKIISVIVIAAAILLACFVIVRFVIYRPVPELEGPSHLEVNRYDVTCCSYDGTTYSYVRHKFKSVEEYNKELSRIRKLMNIRGIKVNDWTPDKLKYPVYSFTVDPVIFKSEKYVHSETCVWSNGYLITSSGDVYRCNPGLGPFMKSDEDDYAREIDTITDISGIRNFRPLFMANNEWNKDMLILSKHNDDVFTDEIEAAVTGISGEPDAMIRMWMMTSVLYLATAKNLTQARMSMSIFISDSSADFLLVITG